VRIAFRLTVLLLALAGGAASPTAQNPEGRPEGRHYLGSAGLPPSREATADRHSLGGSGQASQGHRGSAGLQASQGRLIEFEVVARQFEFAPSRLEVSQGDKVRILVRSEDRNHGFAIRKLKIDKILPANGKVVTIEFQAKDAGTFEIICSESCGDGHKEMKGSLVVLVGSLAKLRPQTDEVEQR
jgi:plastocyanin